MNYFTSPTLAQFSGKTALLILFKAFSLSGIFAQSEGFFDEKVQQRIQKRFIHSKSKYLAISAGIGFTATHIQDPNGFLTEGALMENNTYMPNIMYEQGLANGFFVEAGYSYIGMGIGHKRSVGELSSSFYSEKFKNHDLQFGIGYRVINQRNYHYFNVHAGLFVGFANEKLEGLPITSTYMDFDPATNEAYSISRQITDFRPYSLGPYIGLSKELRLTKGFSFFIKYTHRFGLINTMSGTMHLQSDEIVFHDDPATFQVRGSGAFVTGGLKILLNKKALEHFQIR